MSELGNTSAIERLNQEAAIRAHTLAAKSRQEAIDIVYQAVGLFLEDDKQNFEDVWARAMPEKESIGLYVTEDMLIAPTDSERPVRAFGILLVNEALYETYRDLDEDEVPDYELAEMVEDELLEEADLEFTRLRVFVPVTEGVNVENFSMPSATDVNEVYLEYALSNANVLRLVVNRDWIHEYRSSADVGGETTLNANEFLRRTAFRVDEGVVTAISALRNIVNMRAVPQRYVDVGSSNVNDV